MTYILCLAHYCDLHGPTPLMVTEGLPASCTVCFEDGAETADDRPRTSPHASSTALNEALKNLDLSRSTSVPASEQDAQAQRAKLLRNSSSNTGANASAIDTPPESPRPAPPHPRRDSSFRRTYDETVTKKQGPCDNCAMTLPRQQAGANSPQLANNARGPTLRTRAPAERVFGASGQASPPNSQTSSDTDGERDEDPRAPRHRVTPSVSSRNTSRSSKSGGTGNSAAAERTPSTFIMSTTHLHTPRSYPTLSP
ncbi:hypothetical protein NXS19_010397 [Fusarium pseudograminearum]|nr:hypothetical protein NXS19_010397 [Fusarium pseudograminearum]